MVQWTDYVQSLLSEAKEIDLIICLQFRGHNKEQDQFYWALAPSRTHPGHVGLPYWSPRLPMECRTARHGPRRSLEILVSDVELVKNDLYCCIPYELRASAAQLFPNGADFSARKKKVSRE